MKSQFIDITGKRFHKLIVLSSAGKDKYGKYKWLCRCDCGNQKEITGTYLRNGDTKSCGCKSNIVDISGSKIGRLFIIKRIKSTKGNSLYECLCECGNKVEIYKSGITSGRTISCGCYNQELRKARTGNKNGWFNKNLTSEDRVRQRHINGYEEWRLSVYKKDNFKCNICKCQNSKLNKLNAHHIINYSLSEDLRTNISNGMTLCTECHKKFHKIYGNKNNNQEQLNEFIGSY